MDEYQARINQQYGQDNLNARILAALQNAGKQIDSLTREDLSMFDEFHIGGIAETRHLAQLAGLRQGMHVLDVGSGLGGPARTLAAEFGCRVTGLDLTEEFCQAAEMLTAQVGLENKVRFQHGSAIDIPFEANTFDVVWMQFSGMNIADKERLYAEIRRVLRPGGLFAVHEIMAGSRQELYYPNFWANEPSISFLRQQATIRHYLAANDFEEVVWNDVTQPSYEWFRGMITKTKEAGSPSLGFQVFIADSVPVKAQNLLRNLEERRVTVIQGIFQLKKQ